MRHVTLGRSLGDANYVCGHNRGSVVDRAELAVPPTPSRRLALGCIALSLLLLAEFTLAVGSRHVDQGIPGELSHCIGNSLL